MQKRYLVLAVAVAAATAVMGARPSCTCQCSTARVFEVVLGGDLDRETGKAKDVRDSFKPGKNKIYCVIGYRSAPSGTALEVTLRYLGGSGRPAATMTSTKRELEGSGRLSLSFRKPKQGWPEGRYEVEVELNGKRVRKVPFTVRP